VPPASRTQELDSLRKQAASQGLQLGDAAAMLGDKESLEGTVKAQHELIESQQAELNIAKATVADRDVKLAHAL
jgi:hypothetical protein